MPIWLWDVEQARIAWANRACLDFSGALSLDELIRLKFKQDAPFARQLALVSKRRSGDAGKREQLRFPTKSGDFIFDCLCSALDIEQGRAGVLVELVADRGIVTSAPDRVPAKTYKNGHLKNVDKEPGLIVEPVVRSVPKAPPKYTPPATNLGDRVGNTQAQKPEPVMNGFEIEAGQVDEDDLRTLREIARMINGPGGGQALGIGPANGSSGRDSEDGRPVVATRKTQTIAKPDASGRTMEKQTPSTQKAAPALMGKTRSDPVLSPGSVIIF